MAARKALMSVDYEVFGRVQGVFFRKYTRAKAMELKLVGWVKNTRKNTVVGQVEGEKANVEKMKQWLTTTGSPSSAIERCVFSNERSAVFFICITGMWVFLARRDLITYL